MFPQKRIARIFGAVSNRLVNITPSGKSMTIEPQILVSILGYTTKITSILTLRLVSRVEDTKRMQ
jgi:hypothetical protein